MPQADLRAPDSAADATRRAIAVPEPVWRMCSHGVVAPGREPLASAAADGGADAQIAADSLSG
jgi:hypothetical protein